MRTTPPSTARPEAARQAGDVRVELSDAAKAKLADNLKFNQKTLSDNLRRALEANNLLTAQADAGLPTITVTVTDIRVRSNFSAVMFGFMAGSDKVVGDVVVAEPDGTVVQSFNVNVSYALGGLAGGQDSTRMDWLYENFAEETVNTLRGV